MRLFLAPLLALLLGSIDTFAVDPIPSPEPTIPPKVVEVVKKSSAIPDRREFPLDPNINPCSNFYDYVCSKVINTFELREDRSKHIFAFSDSGERLLNKKKDFFQNLAKRDGKSPRETGLKNYYMACMNQEASIHDEKAEVARIKKAFHDLKTSADFSNWVENAHLNSETDPIEWGAIANFDQPDTSDLYISTDFMTLPEKSFYKKPEVMADFKDLVTTFFETIHESNPQQRAQKVLDFEAGLADIYPAPQEFREIVNNRSFISKADLLKNLPALKLETLLKKLPEKIVIRDWVPGALKYLNDYMTNAPIDDLRTIFIFHALYETLDDSAPAFFQKRFDFNKKDFGGPNQRPVREERCTTQVMNTFGKELDSILLPEIFPHFPREKVVALAEKIRSALVTSLEDNQWLTAAARKEAVAKMKQAKLYLVSPETDSQWDFLPQGDYSPLKPEQNSKTVTQVYKTRSLLRLNNPEDPGRWGMSPLTVNAYYDGSHNKFVLPIGILQDPFFDANASLEQNLGAMGSVIGHELGHGVDDQGSRYDADGKQRQWMAAEDLKKFATRTQLLISQFDGAGQNGHLTLGENIGDLTGVTMARKALTAADSQFLKDRSRQKTFFESFGRVWCGVIRPKYAETLIKTDPHSLSINRVNEQMKQQPLFKEAYQCKDKDAMVLPSDKIVHLW